ncbi:MAG: hypothetical protein JNM85_06140 [Chthonomonas sp.]|nr:hypothetical protein [Chthonomonas sp.]
MLEQLHDLAVDQPRHLGPLYWKVNTDEIAMQIAKIRASLPQEVKQAASVTRESEQIVKTARQDADGLLDNAKGDASRLLDEAKQEADLIIEQAKLEQTRLLAESEILKLAKSQAEEIRNSAGKDATSRRREADDYSYHVLKHVENVLGKAIRSVEAGMSELESSVDGAAPLSPQAVIESREKVRV